MTRLGHEHSRSAFGRPFRTAAEADRAIMEVLVRSGSRERNPGRADERFAGNPCRGARLGPGHGHVDQAWREAGGSAAEQSRRRRLGLLRILDAVHRRRPHRSGRCAGLDHVPGHRDVDNLQLRHGMVPVAWGVAFGVAGSLAAGGVVVGVFPQAAGVDPVTYLLVVPGLVTLTLLSAYVPAHSATRIDPLVALRQE